MRQEFHSIKISNQWQGGVCTHTLVPNKACVYSKSADCFVKVFGHIEQPGLVAVWRLTKFCGVLFQHAFVASMERQAVLPACSLFCLTWPAVRACILPTANTNAMRPPLIGIGFLQVLSFSLHARRSTAGQKLIPVTNHKAKNIESTRLRQQKKAKCGLKQERT